MNISEISNRIYYAGINNRTSELFEELWPIPHGVSYNSYVVVGDKIALIDTVPACYCIKFLHKIADIIAEETGTKAYCLESIQNVTKDDFINGETWVSLMSRNAETLKKGL